MRRIKANDCAKLEGSVEKIFDIISDVRTYPNWWPTSVKVKVLEHKDDGLGSKIEVRAAGGWFRCTITSVDKPTKIGIQYYDGVQKGEGWWTITKIDENLVQVCYTIDLEPYGFVPRILSNFLDFSKIHSNLMKDIYKKIQYLLSM